MMKGWLIKRFRKLINFSMEEDYLNWAPGQINAIGEYFGVVVDASSQKKPHIPLFNAVILEHSDKSFRGEMTAKDPRNWKHISKSKYNEVNPAKSFDSKHPFYSHILNSRTLFNNSKDIQTFPNNTIQIKSKLISVQGNQVTIPRQCYHIEFDLANSGFSYTTGDHLGVWGNNDPGQVEKLLNLLKVEKPDSLVNLVPNSENSLSSNAKTPFPLPCSIRDMLTYYLDILSPLKQHHFLVSL
jgi:NADPH-ferrihemoprotein reductase